MNFWVGAKECTSVITCDSWCIFQATSVYASTQPPWLWSTLGSPWKISSVAAVLDTLKTHPFLVSVHNYNDSGLEIDTFTYTPMHANIHKHNNYYYSHVFKVRVNIHETMGNHFGENFKCGNFLQVQDRFHEIATKTVWTLWHNLQKFLFIWEFTGVSINTCMWPDLRKSTFWKMFYFEYEHMQVYHLQYKWLHYKVL